MAIDAKLVKKLRDQTGAGMMDCKNALTETNGDLEKAIDHLTFELEKLEEQNKWVTEQYNRNRSPEDWVM